MKTPTLANIKKKERFHIYIGRANSYLGLPQSKWHNPFKLNKDEPRGSTLEKAREYFYNSPELIAALPELSGKILGCYCYSSATDKGSRCHGHILIEMFEEFVLKEKREF